MYPIVSRFISLHRVFVRLRIDLPPRSPTTTLLLTPGPAMDLAPRRLSNTPSLQCPQGSRGSRAIDFYTGRGDFRLDGCRVDTIRM
jgi:hypothetical protein